MELTDWPLLKSVQSHILKATRLAYVFGKNGSDALLVTHIHRVYAIGKNEKGYLGLGDEIPRFRETELTTLSDKHVKGFTTGGVPESLFLIAYLEDGTVYEWGCVPGCARPVLKPYLVANFRHKVVDVACGISHCVALCENGEIYTWGVNARGNLGRIVVERYNNLIPKSLVADRVEGILDYNKAAKISCGAYFSVVVLQDKRVVTWGCNKFGQLGIGKQGEPDLPFVSFPTYIHRLRGVQLLKLVCCPASVFALDTTNSVYFWGNNRPSYVGPLNGNKPSLQVNSPVKYGFRRYVDIGATYLFDLAVLQGDGWHLILGIIEPKFREMKCKSINDVFFNCVSHMYQPLCPVKNVRTLSDVLAFEFDNPEKSDFTVSVENKSIYVHKMILSMRSYFFGALLQNTNESHKHMFISAYSYQVIHTYLKFLYTDVLSIDLDLAIDLLKLSDDYREDDLKAKCVEIIKKQLTATRIVDVYPLLSKIKGTEALIPLCIDIASKNLSSIVTSDQFDRNWDTAVLKHFLIHLAERLSKS